MFRGKLSAAFQTKARQEGKSEIATQGRYCGGVKFYGDKWITANEDEVNMDAINEFDEAGFLDIDWLTVKDSRPPVEQRDVMAQAEVELAEDAEIEAELNQCKATKGDGDQCTRNALEGSLYCGTHKKLEG